MTIRAVFFDLGGVILRTEFESPRQHLAERLNIEYQDLVRLVFESETSRLAFQGELTAEEHWAAVVKRLGRPPSELRLIREEFFAGDVLDRGLLTFIHSLRPTMKTGMISNAWDDLRAYLAREKITDAFDTIVISAEVGRAKPDPEIYRLALEQAQVEPHEALFVDDVQANIEGCERVGMRGILFRDPDMVIQEIKALI